MKELEQRLNKRIERLTRSNDDLYQFAYLAAHELQAPLSAMEGFLLLIQSHCGSQLSQEGNQWLKEALCGSDRMRALIQALLTLSRVDSQDLEYELVDSRAAADDALRNLKMLIDQKNAQIEIDSLPTLPANHALLMLLFQNLIGNALKFCAKRPAIKIAATQSDAEWIFSVSDNGVGFDMKYLDRLFHRFERLHSKVDYPGTGLGLALCKRIVDRHGGRIWAKSHLENGSTFYFTVPAEKGQARCSETSAIDIDHA